MANWSDLKAAVAEVIKTNGNNEITGQILQDTLNSIISNVGANATLVGVATPTTNPGAPDGNVFYFATQAGTYSNFSAITIDNPGFYIISWNGSTWSKSNVMSIVQTIGTGKNVVMSQKTVTDELLKTQVNGLRSYLEDKIEVVASENMGGIYSFYVKKGNTVRVLFTSNDASFSTITININKDGSNIQYVENIQLGVEKTFIANNDCNYLQIYGTTLSSGIVNLQVIRENSELTNIKNDISENSENISSVKDNIAFIEDKFLYEVCQDYNIDSSKINYISFSVDIKQGDKCKIIVSSNGDAEVTDGKVQCSIRNNGGNTQYIIGFGLNEWKSFTANNDANRFSFYISSSYIIKNGTINILLVKENSIPYSISEIEYNVSQNTKDIDNIKLQSLYEVCRTYDVKTTENVSAGYEVDIKKGDILYVIFESDEDCINDSKIVCNINNNDSNIQYIVNISLNSIFKFIAGNNANRFDIYVAKDNILSNGTILVKVFKENGTIYQANSANKEIGEVLNYNIYVSQNVQMVGQFNIDIKQGDKFKLLFSSESNDYINKGAITCNINNRGSIIQYITDITLGEWKEFTASENATTFSIYAANTDVVKSGIINILLLRNGSILDRLNNGETEISKNANNIVITNDRFDGIMSILGQLTDLIPTEYKNKKVGILGDSYSTFANYIVSGDVTWYPMSVDRNNVQSVEQTWWKQVCNSITATSIINDSYSGSTICLKDNTSYSFVERMKNSFNGTNEVDIIFVFGGTNDFWQDIELGSYKYSDWTNDDLKQLYPATCYMFDYLKTNNPNSIIINLLNGIIDKNITDGMTEIANHYSISSIYLSSDEVSKMDGHPDIKGMKSIYSRIIFYLMNN